MNDQRDTDNYFDDEPPLQSDPDAAAADKPDSAADGDDPPLIDTSQDGEPPSGPERTPAASQVVEDRATRAGYPPDSGPEQHVLKVRPAFFRAKPLPIAAFAVVPPLVAFVAWWLGGENGASWAAWSGGVLAVASLLYVAVWWVVVTRSRGLVITNKRTTEVRGLFSKSTDEVLHDHVRNVTVDQSFYERVTKIGRLGIASSGQAGTEIEMRDLPKPDKIREIIDLYRPVG